MEMEIQSGTIESVTKDDILSLASWDQPRSSEQIIDFIKRREAEIFATDN